MSGLENVIEFDKSSLTATNISVICFHIGDRKRKNSTEEKAVPMKNGKRYT